MIGSNIVLYSSNNVCFLLASVDVGLLKSHLPKNIIPSNPTHHLGLRLEKVKVPWSLQALMAYFLAENHGNVSMSLDH